MCTGFQRASKVEAWQFVFEAGFASGSRCVFFLCESVLLQPIGSSLGPESTLFSGPLSAPCARKSCRRLCSRWRSTCRRAWALNFSRDYGFSDLTVLAPNIEELKNMKNTFRPCRRIWRECPTSFESRSMLFFFWRGLSILDIPGKSVPMTSLLQFQSLTSSLNRSLCCFQSQPWSPPPWCHLRHHRRLDEQQLILQHKTRVSWKSKSDLPVDPWILKKWKQEVKTLKIRKPKQKQTQNWDEFWQYSLRCQAKATEKLAENNSVSTVTGGLILLTFAITLNLISGRKNRIQDCSEWFHQKHWGSKVECQYFRRAWKAPNEDYFVLDKWNSTPPMNQPGDHLLTMIRWKSLNERIVFQFNRSL